MRSEGNEHLVEVLATPFCGVLTGVAVEHGEEALAVYLAIWSDKGVGVFHEASRSLGVCDATSKRKIRGDARV